MVKHVEGFGAKLQVDSFGDFHILEKIGIPGDVAGTNECVTAQVADATQTWGAEQRTGIAPTIRPLCGTRTEVGDGAIRTVIFLAIQVVVAASIDAKAGVDPRL